MTDKIMEARRAKFEVIACEHYLLCELDHSWSELDLEYVNTEMQVAFEVYNAALDSLCVELPKFADDYAYNDGIGDCQEAIHVAGVKTR